MIEKCPYLEFFWSVCPRIRTEHRETLRISPYLVRMRENTEQKNSEYEHFMQCKTRKTYEVTSKFKCENNDL